LTRCTSFLVLFDTPDDPFFFLRFLFTSPECDWRVWFVLPSWCPLPPYPWQGKDILSPVSWEETLALLAPAPVFFPPVPFYPVSVSFFFECLDRFIFRFFFLSQYATCLRTFLSQVFAPADRNTPPFHPFFGLVPYTLDLHFVVFSPSFPCRLLLVSPPPTWSFAPDFMVNAVGHRTGLLHHLLRWTLFLQDPRTFYISFNPYRTTCLP